MKRLTLLLILMISAACGQAQHTLAGKITYERKINIWALLNDNMDKDDDKEWLAQIKATTPQFKSTYFDLSFNSARAIYKPGKEVEGNKTTWTEGPAKENIVLTDLVTKKVKAAKLVYEQKFLVQDSMRELVWKEKPDLRTIAGYKCHKAVGRICDSVYVVAFYAEDIPAAAGPELFGGLPGMILELAIPRLHTTWTATNIETIPPADADFTMPEKGKKVTEKELGETLQASLKDWGKAGHRNIWWSVL